MLLEFVFKCFAFTPQANFLPIIWIFTEGEGDGIESRLSSYFFFTLKTTKDWFIKNRIKHSSKSDFESVTEK